MKNNKRPSIRMRLLAWMMAAIMMCTGLNVTAYAQEISFDDGYALEQQEEQVTDEKTAEEIQQDDSDTEISFEGPWDTEDTDEDDITIEDAQAQDDSDTEEADADEVDVFSDADDQNAVEAFSDGDSESDGETAKVTVNFSFSQDDRFADDEFEDGAISEPGTSDRMDPACSCMDGNRIKSESNDYFLHRVCTLCHQLIYRN